MNSQLKSRRKTEKECGAGCTTLEKSWRNKDVMQREGGDRLGTRREIWDKWNALMDNWTLMNIDYLVCMWLWINVCV